MIEGISASAISRSTYGGGYLKFHSHVCCKMPHLAIHKCTLCKLLCNDDMIAVIMHSHCSITICNYSFLTMCIYFIYLERFDWCGHKSLYTLSSVDASFCVSASRHVSLLSKVIPLFLPTVCN